MPGFGKLHDDGLFFVSAKSLATGHGLRILSLPEQPAQTKYPSLYPLYLSIVWRINPHFPENLTLAAWFSWGILALCLSLVWLFWRGEGWSAGRKERWSEPRIWILVGLLAMNPYIILFGCNLFSEIFFLCWLLAVLIVGNRSLRGEGIALAALAGMLAGCAYLSRTAGIALGGTRAIGKVSPTFIRTSYPTAAAAAWNTFWQRRPSTPSMTLNWSVFSKPPAAPPCSG